MDTSKEFQLMLDKAIESEPLAFKDFDRTKNVQDQLQEIHLKSLPKDEQDSSNIMVVILDDFQDWVLNDCTGLGWSYHIQVSMEQLWLAFCMSGKFNKIWDGNEWK